MDRAARDPALGAAAEKINHTEEMLHIIEMVPVKHRAPNHWDMEQAKYVIKPLRKAALKLATWKVFPPWILPNELPRVLLVPSWTVNQMRIEPYGTRFAPYQTRLHHMGPD